MTSLSKRSTKLRFTTGDLVREKGKYRAVSIEAHTMFARVRCAGLHSYYDLPWSAMYSLGAKMEARRIKEEKAGKK